jgi:ribosome biogenesis GTPase A
VDTTISGRRGAESENEASLRSYARRRAQVADCLDELATINAEVGQTARAARIRESREALLDQRFTLLVLGEFKRGKSTLVNCLVGREVLPVGAAPTTAVITRITYGEEPAARLIMTDGAERAV